MKKLTLKKLIYSVTACSALAATAALAGGPDLVAPAPAPAPSVIPFVDLQLGAAWRNVNNIEFPVGTIFPGVIIPPFTRSRSHFAGRVAAGLQFPITPQFKVTSELGWGYYGRDRFNNLITVGPGVATIATNVRVNTWGFDAFVGGMYTVMNNFDIFGKVGAVMETYRTRLRNLITVPAAPFTSAISISNNRSEAVPAIMVGAQYDINQWLGIHVAYMHTFGGKLRFLQLRVDPGFANVALNRNISAPTINAVFGGLELRLPT